MPIDINEIRIITTISEQEVKKQDKQSLSQVNIDAIISAAVESVLEKLKEMKED